jgi:hypothetical protein
MTASRCVLFFALALGLATAACGGATTTPRIRVARDLGCTAEQTSVQRVSEHNWEVRGCGKVATYRCTYPVRDCWREGEIRSEVSEPQTPIGSNEPAR